jgi:cation diffusion facilitator family transporter
MVKEKKNAALLSVVAAVFLTCFKLIVGLLTGSLGILSEALHSALDLVAAVVTFFSVRLSDKPADKDHNYGHGKVENLSALIETILLFVTCFWIIYEAANRLITGNMHIEISIWAYVVVILSIVIDVNRSRMLYKVAKKHNSQALEADALHFSTDIWSSSVVLLGLICANLGIHWADPVAALAVAAIVLSVSYRLGKKAIDVLLDKAPADTLEKVRKVISQYPEIMDFHSLKARTAGADTFIKFNIHLDPQFSLLQAHELCDKLEKEISAVVPRSEIYIHSEPHESEHVATEKKDGL